MSDNIQKITTPINDTIPNLLLQLHVRIVNEYKGKSESFYNLFTAGGKSYLRFDLPSFMTLELKDGVWSRDKSIIITQRNLFQLKRGFQKCRDGIMNGDVFAMTKNEKIIMYPEKAQEHTVRIFNLGMNQRIILKPAIIYDDNEMSYEGVVMFINKTENFIQMPIDAFESLYDSLMKVDLFMYSHMVLNAYLATLKLEKVEVRETVIENKPKKTKVPVFTDEEKEYVHSNTIPEKTAEEYFGIGNKNEK